MTEKNFIENLEKDDLPKMKLTREQKHGKRSRNSKLLMNIFPKKNRRREMLIPTDTNMCGQNPKKQERIVA